MARYEGMDELLQRVQERLVESSAATERPEPDMRLPGATPASPDFYSDVVEQAMRIRHRTQELHSSLTVEQLRLLSQPQHEHLLRLLRDVVQDVWRCESALDRVANKP